MLRAEAVAKRLGEVFRGGGEMVLCRAPGRVNLIGEHTDYNDGFVLPMAIEREVLLAGRTAPGRTASVYSTHFDRLEKFSLDDIRAKGKQAWLDYPAGVASLLQGTGVKVPGFEVVLASDVPIGSGLSSSAALEVAFLGFMLELAGARMEPVEMAKLARRVENEFVGVKCGIMDQFISVMGQKDHALLIDCRDLSHRAVPTFGDDYEFVICETGVKHELASSEYHKRQEECREAVATLKSVKPTIRALRDATLADLEKVKAKISDKAFRRARHVITEDGRVEKAVRALEAGDAAGFGELMNGSHESLRDDYEVSCAELDLTVELAREHGGVLGARMTGGGFGGATVNLVRTKNAEEFSRDMASRYREETGLKMEVIRTRGADGVRTWRTDLSGGRV